MGANFPREGTLEYYALHTSAAVTVGDYMQQFGTFVITTAKKIFHISTTGVGTMNVV